MKFEAFDSTEKMVEAVQKSQRDAFNAMKQWQAELRPGDKVLVLDPDMPIFQELLEEEDKVHRRKFPQYMYVRAHSVVCPEGELGSACRCNAAVKLTDKEWELFKNSGWLIDPTNWPMCRDLQERIRKNMEEAE